MDSVIIGGDNSSPSTAATRYNVIFGQQSWATIESDAWQLVSTDGFIKNLRIEMNNPPGVGDDWDFTLMLNGAPTALTVNLTGAAVTGEDLVNQIDVTGGDYVSLRAVPTGPPSGGVARWTVEFGGDNAGESLLLGASPNGVGTSGIEYMTIATGRNVWSNDEEEHYNIMPTAGIIKNFYVRLVGDPGTNPDALRFTVRKNGATPGDTLSVTIVADDTTGNDLVNEVAVAAGDLINIMCEPLNTPAFDPEAHWGFTFVSSSGDESIVLGTAENPTDDTNTEYSMAATSRTNWSAVEVFQLAQAAHIGKFYVRLGDAPGAGKKYDFTIRTGGAGSNVVVSISDAETTNNSGELVDTVANGETIGMDINPDGTPTITDHISWGFVISDSSIPFVSGWVGEISGVTNPASIAGVLSENIFSVKGVE